MASNNTAKSSETASDQSFKDITSQLSTLQLLIVVTLLLVIVLIISKIVLFFLSCKKNKKKSNAVPSAVVIAKAPKRNKKDQKGNGAEKSQKSERQQANSHLPSKTVMVELDMTDKKDKKAEDLPPVVSLSLSAPPAYTTAAVTPA